MTIEMSPEKLQEIRAKMDALFEAAMADDEGVAFYGLNLVDDAEVLEYIVAAATVQGKLDSLVERGQKLHGRVAWTNTYLSLRKSGFSHELALTSANKAWKDARKK